MKKLSARQALLPGIVALALGLTACGGDSNASTDGEAADLSGSLNIGGASSQQSAQQAWIVGFSEIAPGVTVNYDPVGSGSGRENFVSGGYPLAGSDAYLTDEEGELSGAKEQCGGSVIEVPNYVSPIAIIFNVEGVDDLNLTPEVLAGIFAGEITQWNDPAIAKSNPDADLPDARITPVHRADDSGTTENFTDYLDAVAPKAWPHGAVETWPGEAGGEAGQGTSGVVQVVTETPNTIGYADASQAGGLGQARIGVGGEFVAPSAEAASKILEVSPRVEGRGEADLAFDLDHTTSQSGTYPIVLTSYLLACPTYEDENTAAMVKAYMEYIVSDEGQAFAAEEAGSAPLSPSLQEKVQGIVSEISAR